MDSTGQRGSLFSFLKSSHVNEGILKTEGEPLCGAWAKAAGARRAKLLMMLAFCVCFRAFEAWKGAADAHDAGLLVAVSVYWRP